MIAADCKVVKKINRDAGIRPRIPPDNALILKYMYFQEATRVLYTVLKESFFMPYTAYLAG